MGSARTRTRWAGVVVAAGMLVSGASAQGDTSLCKVTELNSRLPRLGQTERVNVASNGTEAGERTTSVSHSSAISADGRYVAFSSDAGNLVAGDTNFRPDVFVHDRQSRQTSRVSIGSGGAQANGFSESAAISADGRYVTFISRASSLVAADTNGWGDVFVHDRQSGQTALVSVANDGTQANSENYGPAISADGRFIAFYSGASNLVSGDTNGTLDVFVRDRQTGQTGRVSVAAGGTQGTGLSADPAISADGRYVTFLSSAPNLVSGDTNEMADVFVHDRATGQTDRVSVAMDGTQANGGSATYSSAISADARFVTFSSSASNLVAGDTNGASDVFVRDRDTGQTTRVSVASEGTQASGSVGYEVPSISATGRYVAFSSWASNLVHGDVNSRPDVFVHDRDTGRTTRVSVGPAGTQAIGTSNTASSPAISADGRHIAFSSNAPNLVARDTNNGTDVFVHDRCPTVPVG